MVPETILVQDFLWRCMRHAEDLTCNAINWSRWIRSSYPSQILRTMPIVVMAMAPLIRSVLPVSSLLQVPTERPNFTNGKNLTIARDGRRNSSSSTQDRCAQVGKPGKRKMSAANKGEEAEAEGPLGEAGIRRKVANACRRLRHQVWQWQVAV
jgi:hypothetical protein